MFIQKKRHDAWLGWYVYSILQEEEGKEAILDTIYMLYNGGGIKKRNDTIRLDQQEHK